MKAFEDRKPDGRPRWLLRSAVAGWIALHARTDATRAAVAVSTLAKVAAASERTVKTALAEVKAEGWILVRERGHFRQLKGKPKGEGRSAATVYDLDIPLSLRATYGWPVESVSGDVSTGNETVSTGNGRAQNVDPQVLPSEVLPQGGRAAGAAPAPIGRCAVHPFTNLNGSGVCALCRSEQIGTRS